MEVCMSTNGRTEARKIHDSLKPDFFKGTVVDKQAAEVLARGR
jgi:hypothetical protein